MTGRMSLISEQVDNACQMLKDVQNIFEKQVKADPKLNQSSLLASVNASKHQKQTPIEFEFKLVPEATVKIISLVRACLQLEDCYYLNGYDRSLEHIVFRPNADTQR